MTNRRPDPDPNVTEVIKLSRPELDRNLESFAQQGIKEVREEAIQESIAETSRSPLRRANMTEVVKPSRAELNRNLEGLAREGIREVRTEAVQEAVAKRRRSAPVAPAKPEPKIAEVPKEEGRASSIVLPLSRPWMMGLVIAVIVSAVGMLILVLVKIAGEPKDPAHVEEVASAVPSAATSVAPSATSPPEILPTSNAPVEVPPSVPPSATVQPVPSPPAARKVKVAPPVVTGEKKDEAPVQPETAPPAAKTTPQPVEPLPLNDTYRSIL